MADKDPSREEVTGQSVNVDYDSLDDGIDAAL